MSSLFFKIPNYENAYEINILGVVRSIDRIVVNKHGHIYNIKGKLLKQTIDGHGYYKVGLSVDNKLKNIRVHSLLAATFLSNKDNNVLVRHLDDNKLNNSLCNLAWGTFKENSIDAVRNKKQRCLKGRNHHWFGRRVPPPNKGKKGVEALNNKIILNTQNGVFYFGTNEAAMFNNINASTLRCKLSGQYKNNTNLIYV